MAAVRPIPTSDPTPDPIGRGYNLRALAQIVPPLAAQLDWVAAAVVGATVLLSAQEPALSVDDHRSPTAAHHRLLDAHCFYHQHAAKPPENVPAAHHCQIPTQKMPHHLLWDHLLTLLLGVHVLDSTCRYCTHATLYRASTSRTRAIYFFHYLYRI
jgi:hypothetical protein